MNTELLNQIQILRILREEVDKAQQARKNSYDIWLIDNKGLLDGEKRLTELMVDADARLRELTLQAYRETGSNAPAPGVSVKIFQHLEYDQQKALSWAIEHRVGLSLDVPAFEKIAKVLTFGFVTITQDPKAMIAKELPPPEKEGEAK